MYSQSNWNLEVLVFMEGRKPENPEKNPRSKDVVTCTCDNKTTMILQGKKLENSEDYTFIVHAKLKITQVILNGLNPGVSVVCIV